MANTRRQNVCAGLYGEGIQGTDSRTHRACQSGLCRRRFCCRLCLWKHAQCAGHGMRGWVVCGPWTSACILSGTKLFHQKFCAELEFLHRILSRSRTVYRNLGFVPVSIIYFQRKRLSTPTVTRTGANWRCLRALTPLVVWKEGRQTIKHACASAADVQTRGVTTRRWRQSAPVLPWTIWFVWTNAILRNKKIVTGTNPQNSADRSGSGQNSVQKF